MEEATPLKKLEEVVDSLIAGPHFNPRRTNRAKIFWGVVDIQEVLVRYAAVFECELRGMVIPKQFKEFAQIIRLNEDYGEEREMIESHLRRLYAGNE
jgi:hypothetical protein